MKLSVEANVAAGTAAAFVALTLGAIAQGRSEGPTGGPTLNYRPMNNPGLNTQMRQQGDDSSLPGRNNAEENRQKFSDEDQTATTPKKAKISTKHHTERTRTQTNQPGD